VDFFTRKAYTTYGIARLALAMHAAIHPAFIFRDPARKFHHVLRFGPPWRSIPARRARKRWPGSPGGATRSWKRRSGGPRTSGWVPPALERRVPSGNRRSTGACNEGIVFLDRDGTLIEEVGYLRDPSAVRILPGAAEALRLLSREGFLLAVVSNQAGLAKGKFTGAEMKPSTAGSFPRSGGGGRVLCRRVLPAPPGRGGGGVPAGVRMPEAGDGAGRGDPSAAPGAGFVPPLRGR